VSNDDLLLEALARIQTMIWLLGDPGGPRHPKDYWEVERKMHWVEAFANDEQGDWDHEFDPFEEFEDANLEQINQRASMLLKLVKDEEIAYQKRLSDRLSV